MKSKIKKMEFLENLIQWFKVHVTATIVSVIVAIAGLLFSIYAYKSSPTSTEKAITNALVAYDALTVPTISEEMLNNNPFINKLYIETELIKGNLKQLKELRDDIAIMRQTSDLELLARPISKQMDVQKVFQKVLATFITILNEKDENGNNITTINHGDGITIEELQEFLILATKVSSMSFDANSELTTILNGLNDKTLSKDKAKKRLTKYLKQYYSDPVNEQYFEMMGMLLLKFQKFSVEKFEYYRLMSITPQNSVQ